MKKDDFFKDFIVVDKRPGFVKDNQVRISNTSIVFGKNLIKIIRRDEKKKEILHNIFLKVLLSKDKTKIAFEKTEYQGEGYTLSNRMIQGRCLVESLKLRVGEYKAEIIQDKILVHLK